MYLNIQERAAKQLCTATATFTYIVDGLTAVRYHYTDVVKWDRDVIILDSGGWQTVTTKRRMNQVSDAHNLGFRVYQRDFEWFVDFKEKTLPFYDGMRLER